LKNTNTPLKDEVGQEQNMIKLQDENTSLNHVRQQND
jgi:hypothetical protein